MEYQQISAGPFCGLFALTIDEYTPWSLEEVIESVSKAEATLNLTDSKKFFVFSGKIPMPKSATKPALFNEDGLQSASLAQILRGRGYKIILQCDGTIYPAHAKEVNFVEAYVQASGKWINFPCTSIIWNIPESTEYAEPRILPQQDAVPKFIHIPSRHLEIVPRILRDSRYPWVVQTVRNPRTIAL